MSVTGPYGTVGKHFSGNNREEGEREKKKERKEKGLLIGVPCRKDAGSHRRIDRIMGMQVENNLLIDIVEPVERLHEIRVVGMNQGPFYQYVFAPPKIPDGKGTPSPKRGLSDLEEIVNKQAIAFSGGGEKRGSGVQADGQPGGTQGGVNNRSGPVCI